MPLQPDGHIVCTLEEDVKTCMTSVFLLTWLFLPVLYLCQQCNFLKAEKDHRYYWKGLLGVHTCQVLNKVLLS